MVQAGEAFSAVCPNITINYVNVELGDTATNMALDGPAGTGADVFVGPHDVLGALVEQGLIYPVANEAALRANVLGSFVNALTLDGTTWGYPIAGETWTMVYNRDLVDTPPRTWDELISFIETFNEENPGMFGLAYDVGNFYYNSMWMTMDGNRLFGPYGTNASDPEVNTPASVAGFTYFQSLRPLMRGVASGDLDTGAVDGLFMAGQSAIHLTGPWNVANFDEAGLNWGVATMFSLPGQTTPALTFAGTRTMFVSAFSEHQDAAHAFALFMTTPEMQQLRVDITGALPTSTADIAMDHPAMAGFAAQMEFAFVMPSIPAMGAVWDALNTATGNIWDGADPQSELDAATAVILDAAG
ncbi:MAG: maltose ABC transporter substrate-binding protein [Promicromonosporaceae bacterium]|nr:maltose ABC transporter substrate-binding protein [Promicromonosporaceae bacterium]